MEANFIAGGDRGKRIGTCEGDVMRLHVAITKEPRFDVVSFVEFRKDHVGIVFRF